MRNPLNKRLFRELRDDLGKYIVIFLLLTMTIGFVSGYQVAGGSMARAYADSFEKYNIEDGNFRTNEALTENQRSRIEEKNIKVYDNFYVEKVFDNQTTLRIFAGRDEVNKVCLMSGKLPENLGEIAIDRMYADNNNLSLGDKIDSEGETYEIVGFVALPDYSALFYSNNDMMFDASQFGVATVSKEQFKAFGNSSYYYNYAFIYDERPETELQEKEVSDKLMESIAKRADLEEFVPRYLNQAIRFAGDDITKDKAMMEVLLWIIIVIMAFVFGITISNTIHKESTVIGTLRASGYTIGELIRHYLAMPMIVTIIAAIIGNIMGYTIFKNVCVDLYYGSYSLTTYETIWNAEAFFKTTAIPAIMMLAITFVILREKLTLSPLKLLRKDLSGKQQKRVIKLNKNIRFLDRFRIRVLIQNRSSYITLFCGLFFANFLLFFGMMLPPLMTHYQDTIADSMMADYTYLIHIPVNAIDSENEISAMFSMMVLKGKIETNNPDAEKFSACTLKTLGTNNSRVEDVTLYGVKDNSRYINADFDDKTVLISSAYADKFGLGKGDVITLKAPYEDEYYGFKVSGVYPYDGGITVFMSQKHLNKILGYSEDFFAGYFSKSEIKDIDKRYIGTVINEESLTRVSRQLMISMGSLMYLVDGFSVVLFMILIYLLSKIIIERNAQTISMTKILGYSGKEIAGLYIIPTALVVLVSLLISYPIITKMMEYIFREMLKQMMSGWIILWLDPSVYVKMFALGVVTYAIVAIFEYTKIRRIPMNEALKNVE